MADTPRKIAKQYDLDITELVNELKKNERYTYDYTISNSLDMPITDPQLLKDYHIAARRLNNPPLPHWLDPRNNMYVRDYILMTASVLMHPKVEVVIKGEGKILHYRKQAKLNNKIVIQRSALEALKNAAKADEKNTDLQTNVALFEELKDKYDMIQFIGGATYEEDVYFGNFIRKNCDSSTILVIGRNASLRQKIEKLDAERQSKDPNFTRIYERVLELKDGYAKNPNDIEKAFFNVNGKRLTSKENTPNQLTGTIPARAGQFVYDSAGNKIPLGQKICDTGGEGIIFHYKRGKCVKIFKQESNTKLKIAKLCMMIDSYENLCLQDAYVMERIAWPQELVFNEHHEPIGFVMREFPKTNKPMAAYNHDDFPQLIPGVRKTHQVRMAKNLAEIISFMHENHIVLCDLNTKNVLFNNHQQAFLVDLDSVQLADYTDYYPASVGIPEYLSPEHIEENHFSFLHKEADDVWIMQMMLFALLTPNGVPYMVNRAPEKELVKKGLYPFQVRGRHKADTELDRKWHNIFSYIPVYVQSAFWESFHWKGRHFREAKRMSATEWLRLMIRYEEELPGLIKQDKLYNEFEPRRYNINEVEDPSFKPVVQSQPQKKKKPDNNDGGQSNPQWDTVTEKY